MRARRRPSPGFGRDDRGLATRLVTLETADGNRWDGMLYDPRRGDPARRRLGVIVVHGSVGNYLRGLPRRLSFGLAGAGYTVLAINTRMANHGVFFGGGLMQDTPLDLDAALDVARRHGLRRLALVGFSMGATMVTHFQALRRPPDVAGLCTLAHPLSLPDSLRRRWDRHGAEPGYEEVAARARRALGAGDEKEGDRIFVVRRASGPSDRPEHAEVWTHRTWWHSRGPEAPHAASCERIGQVTVPVALIQAGADELIPPAEGPELARIARAGECPAAEVVTIAEADHVFAGHEEAAITAAAAWLERLV